MQNKFLTMVTYKSGRRELFSDKSEKAMRERRKYLASVSTVTDVRTPTIQNLEEIRNEKNSINQK